MIWSYKKTPEFKIVNKIAVYSFFCMSLAIIAGNRAFL